ncbi:MAG: hypothetical protein ACAI35_06520 [Candidatus Methylacidiphilales bacterium]
MNLVEQRRLSVSCQTVEKISETDRAVAFFRIVMNYLPPCWFRLDHSAGACHIEFQSSPDRKWNPTVIAEYPLPTGTFSRKVVHLSGGAPMWMYGHTAFLAVQDGAREIWVYQPQTGNNRVYPLVAAESVRDPGWTRLRPGEAGGTILEFVHGEWSPTDLPHLDAQSSLWDSRLVTLTGRGTVWMYAAAACLAAAHRVQGRKVLYYSPREDGAVLLNPTNGDPVQVPASPELSGSPGFGKILGILGDPNSGKSVFSYLLSDALLHTNVRSKWRMDADFAAPTPDWYVRMVAQNRKTEADELRSGHKRSWSKDAEDSLALQLQNCARSIHFTIADFPGGIHNSGIGTNLPVRVPPNRDKLLGVADGYVVVVRSDQKASILEGWRQALAKHDLADRIVAVVESGNPKELLSCSMSESSGVIQAVCCGLDRGNVARASAPSTPQGFTALAQALVNRLLHAEAQV